MDILFTTSKYPTSWLIRKITGDDCSHCAIRFKNLILHSDFMGVRIIPERDFLKKNIVLHTLKGVNSDMGIFSILHKYSGKRYDFGGLLYLGLRYLLPFLPKANIWQTSGMFLCTEFITEVINGQEDSLITPHRLYERLKEK